MDRKEETNERKDGMKSQNDVTVGLVSSGTTLPNDTGASFLANDASC